MDYLIALHRGGEIRTVTLRKGERATVGAGEGDTLRLAGLGETRISLRSIGDGVHVLANAGLNRILSAGETVIAAEGLTLAVFECRCGVRDGLSLASLDKVTVGRSSRNDICLREAQVSSSHAVLQKKDGAWFISDLGSSNGTFVGGRFLGPRAARLEEGTTVFIAGFQFELREGALRFENTPGEVAFSPNLFPSLLLTPRERRSYPAFYRSPRLRAMGENAEVEVLAPPSGGNKPSISWLSVLLPPCMMAIVMLSMAVFMRNTTTIFYTLPMSMVSVLMAVVNYKSQMKKWRQTQELVQKKYTEHLMEKEEEITAVETSYLSILTAINPGVRECVAIARDVSRRLWERTPRDADFLTVRLGTGQIPSNVAVKIPKEQLTLEENPFLKEAAKLRERHAILDGVPICHSFLEAPITGLVGSREDVQRTAWMILMDIAAHHSYEDVKIVCVYPEGEKDKWEWIRWLPHVWNPARTQRSLCCTADVARPRLRELAEVLKVRRRESSDQRGEGAPTTPFYFLVLADKALVECSGEQFLPDNSALGFAALYAYGDIASLPGECQAIVECGNPGKGRQGVVRRTSSAGGQSVFMPDRIQLSWMDEFARAMAPVRLRSSGGSGIPTKVSFLQGLKAKRVEDLNLMRGWESRRTYESLATPIGVKENGDVFNFDIHEKFMGVHGAVAGTSGSGKSEMLTAWLLSMAAHFSPVDVNFLLIEFKGNDLSNILRTLPHMAGVVSNLQDSSIIERSLRSLDGEKERRARIFESIDELSSKNISEYQKYQKKHPEREDLEPLPYLITVLDEFAEFKSQFPDQMDLFNSITRVGRSYGIYMVISTQSPGGIITPQMESNIRFRICLRTANTGESKEIIGTTDAFFISNPGRAYVKVGDSIYEQVQTFYSKAPYNPKAGEKAAVTEINLVELDGRRVRPQARDKTVGAAGDVLSEGQMVVRSIVETAKQNQLPRARPVWTEPLPPHPDKNNPKKLHYLFLSGMSGIRRAFQNDKWEKCNDGLAVVVGLVDNPEAQRQYPFVLDFMKEGHQILYGAPSAGKTTFLQTALLSAALSYTPEQVQFLVLDFGNWGMKIFEGLPHMLMVADAGDKEKLGKAEEYILSTLDSRKRLFASQGVGTLEAYREVSGAEIPALILAVDNMASLYNQYPDMMDTLIQVAREGGGLGVYLLLTAGNPGSFMFRVAQYVKSSHALQLTDRSDYRQLVGGTGRQEPGHYPGRGFTKGPLEFQTALCVEAATEGERVKQLRAICTAMREGWKGPVASMDPAPQVVDAQAMVFTKDGAQIGLDSTAAPVEFDFAQMNGCIISGSPESGKSNTLGLVARALGQDEGTTVFLYEKGNFLESLCPGGSAAHDGAGADALLSGLGEEYDRRSDEEGDYAEKRIALCIDDFSTFFEEIAEENVNVLDVIVRNGADYGIYVYIAGDRDGLARLHTFLVKPFESCLAQGNALVLGGRLKEHSVFDALYKHEDVALSGHEACMIHNKIVTQLKLAKI